MRMRITVLAILLFLLPTVLFAAKKEKKEKPDVAESINTPRSEARKVSFEATEGTWISIDVSPDGKTIAFDLLGDIYTMPVSGGDAKVISSGPAWDAHPRYSPDGKAIAFSSDRGGIENIWLMGSDGSKPRALSEEKDSYVRGAAWSPEGNFVFVRKEDGKLAGIPPVELWMLNIHGGTGVKVTSSDDINNGSGPVASRDGRYLYFSARERRFNYIPDLRDGMWQIHRYDRMTGETAVITSGFGGAARPAISPDGSTLVFVSRRDDRSILVARDLASGVERTLLPDIDRDEMEGFAQADLWHGYAFTPDGSALVFSHRGKIVKLDVATGMVTGIPFKAKVDQWFAPRVTWQEKLETGPVQGHILRWPNQSADGKLLAFDAFGRIWLQKLDGAKAIGAPRRLTSDGAALPQREYGPSFSNDGRWITYVTWSDKDGGQIWKAVVPSGDAAAAPQKVTTAKGHYANPVFSPAGDRIAFVRGSGLEFRGRQPEEEGRWEILWLPSDGGDSTYVTSMETGDSMRFHPKVFWNRDGSRLFYRDPVEPEKPTDDPKHDLTSVRLDGTDKRKLLRFPAVGDVIPSPDEQWIAFSSRDNVYVTAMPPLFTSEPAEVAIDDGAVPVWRLSEHAGGYAAWADGGKTITWGLGNQFHRLSLVSAIAFAEEQKQKASAKKDDKKKDDKKKDGKSEEKEVAVPRSEVIPIALSMPRPVPSGSYVLRGARIITMKGDEVLENADLLVTSNRIAAVGPAGSVTVPSGAREMDAKGMTIIPGIIDSHAHLHYSAMELFPDTKWEYIANLAYGVTTTYDPSAPSLDVFAQAEMVEAGLMVGPRIYSSGDVLYGGQRFDIWAKVDDLEDARRQVRRMKAYGARMIKVYQQPRRSQRLWFAEACRELKMLLTAEGGGELFTDMTMALDGYTAFEHALPVELRKDIVEFTAKSGTHYTPTLLVAYGGPWGELYYWQTRNPHDDPKLRRFVPHLTIDVMARRHPWIWPSEYHFPTVARGAAAVVDAGGNVSLGAHGQLQGLGVHWEIWAMAGDGQPGDAKAMTPMQALRASTIAAADKIGFAPDLGSIEKGKMADFVVLGSNPLDDIHNTTDIRWVAKNGELFDGATMAKEWPEKTDAPKLFWEAQ